MRVNFTADEIARMSRDEVWALPEGGLRITFSDQTKIVATNRIKVCWYFWQLYVYGDVKGISYEMFLSDPDFNGSLPRKLLSKIFWDVYFRKSGGFRPGVYLDFLWDLTRRTYQAINELYNDSIFKMSEHVSTLDLDHVIAILDDLDIIEAKKRFNNGEILVDESHDVTWNAMTTKEEYKQNELARGCAADIFNRRQTNQGIGPRAFIPDINGEAFTDAIRPGYSEGLDSHYDRIIESRTASIAYFMAKAPLEQSEYNNRMAQFLCSCIGEVSHKDCGTKHTVSWRVKDKKDLKRLRGKFMMVNSQPVMIYGNEEELIDTIVELRSFTKCESENQSSPCAICVGWNAWTTPPGTNLGHHLSTEPLARISQLILSTKHVISSTKPLFLEINHRNAGLIELNPQNMYDVHLVPQDNIESIELRISRDEAFFIDDVNHDEYLDDLVPSRISNVSNIQLMLYPKEGRVKTVTIPVEVGGRGCPLSIKMLHFLHDKGWDVVGNYISINLDEWDFGNPIITTPRRGADMMSVLYMFQNFVNSPTKPDAVRAVDYTEPGPAIEALMGVLTEYIEINFNHAEVFVKALMCKVLDDGTCTYEVPRPGDKFEFGTMKNIIVSRSAGPGMAFENHSSVLFGNPETYLKDGYDIPETNLDYCWME